MNGDALLRLTCWRQTRTGSLSAGHRCNEVDHVCGPSCELSDRLGAMGEGQDVGGLLRRPEHDRPEAPDPFGIGWYNRLHLSHCSGHLDPSAEELPVRQ